MRNKLLHLELSRVLGRVESLIAQLDALGIEATRPDKGKVWSAALRPVTSPGSTKPSTENDGIHGWMLENTFNGGFDAVVALMSHANTIIARLRDARVEQQLDALKKRLDAETPEEFEAEKKNARASSRDGHAEDRYQEISPASSATPRWRHPARERSVVLASASAGRRAWVRRWSDELSLSTTPMTRPCAHSESFARGFRYLSSGAVPARRAANASASSQEYDIRTRSAEGGRFATESPGRHSVAGRIGRGVKPPPQLGQTLRSRATQSRHQVHSYVQIIASAEAGGRSRSQPSQLGRSSSAIGALCRRCRR